MAENKSTSDVPAQLEEPSSQTDPGDITLSSKVSDLEDILKTVNDDTAQMKEERGKLEYQPNDQKEDIMGNKDQTSATNLDEDDLEKKIPDKEENDQNEQFPNTEIQNNNSFESDLIQTRKHEDGPLFDNGSELRCKETEYKQTQGAQNGIANDDIQKKPQELLYAEMEDDKTNEYDVLIKPEKNKNENLSEYPVRKWSPRKDAFFFSKYISFFWLNKLFVKGSKKILDKDDLQGIMPGESMYPLTEKLERSWHREAYNEDGNIKKEASLMKAVFNTFGWRYLALGLCPLFSEIMKLVQPVLVGFLIEYFLPNSKVSTDRAYLYVFVLILTYFVVSWTEVASNYEKQIFGARFRISLTGLVYKKILRTSPQTLGSFTTGNIVNLVSADATRMEVIAKFMHYVFVGPIIFSILVVFLYKEIGPSSLVGVFILVLLAPMQMVMGKLAMWFRRKGLKFTDERVKIMNEIISGMKIIKLYTWEESFAKVIESLRGKEIQKMRNLNWLRGGLMSFFFTSGSLVCFLTFMTYVLTGNQLTSKKVFTSLGLFNIARRMFTLQFPLAVSFFFEAQVCLGRIQKFLLAEEHKNEGPLLRPKLKDCRVQATDVTAAWTEDMSTLKGISFNVKAGELLAVIGAVGSGKSSLLMAILKELPLKEGKIDVRGKVAYTSQEAWIFNGTVRYNITFGQEFNGKRYNDVIKACALEKDLKLFPDGDKTLVGERGVSLSGGQKARISLARAVYADADIYLLDDPLSAVDAEVGRHLYNKCINGYLAEKVKILVTHQQQYLTNASLIIALKEGEVVCQGSLDEINCLSIDIRSSIICEESEDTGFESTGPELPSTKLKAPPLIREISRISRQDSVLATSISDMASSMSIARELEIDVVEEENNDLMPKEEKQEGTISWSVYTRFFGAGYGPGHWVILLLVFFIGQAVFVLTDWWLSNWSTEEEANMEEGYKDRQRDLIIYAVLTFSLLVLGLARGFVFFNTFLKSSQNIYLKMFSGIMRAPMYFFDTNSIGRILNRCSKDTNLVDDILCFSCHEILATAIVILSVFILIAIKMPIILVLLIPVIIIGVMTRVYYMKTARELRRIESVGRSPVYSHLSTSLLGITTIRSYGVAQKFFDTLADLQDEHSEAFIAYLSSFAWLNFHLELLCALFIAFCAIIPVVLPQNFDAGTVGLLLVYALNIPPVLQRLLMWSTEVESHFTSVERVLEYCDLEPEAALETDVKPDKDWPNRGSVMFENVHFRYHETLPEILHGINAHVKPKEKIGVCGRTGAGKSSLLAALFRTAELSGGKLIIDGIDIQTLGLRDLRRKLSIIPQEPILFSGTMRKNLDPFSDYDDMELWNALEEVRLKEAVMDLPGKLEGEITESGGNLSVGQKQLVCLARAILERNRILVIDEATANVDVNTDALIQETIRTKFKDCTVLTIAHRLQTIMDSSRIMVLDAGNLKEFDRPYKLLRCKNSLLYSLVIQTGKCDAQNLFELAYKSYLEATRVDESELKAGLMGDCNFKCRCKRKSRSGSKSGRSRKDSEKSRKGSRKRHSSKSESSKKSGHSEKDNVEKKDDDTRISSHEENESLNSTFTSNFSEGENENIDFIVEVEAAD